MKHISLLILLCVFASPLVAFEPAGSKSGLCSRDQSTLSCAQQLSKDLPEKSCEVDAIVKNDTTCRDWFAPVKPCNRLTSCGVILRPFTHVDDRSEYNFTQTAFNVTFAQPTSDMMVRFERLDGRDFRFCRRFRLDELALSFRDSTVWFDCLFHDQTYASVEFALDFKVDDRTGRYVFLVPLGIRQEVEDLPHLREIFIYLHYDSLPKPVVTFQKLPGHFGKDFYKLRIIKWDRNLKETLKTLIVDTKNPATFAHEYMGMVTVDMGIELDGGNYSIEIEMDDPRVAGIVRSTPFFAIIDDKLPVMLITCVAVAVLGIILLCVFLILWKCSANAKKGMLLPNDVKSILFLYDPVSAAHVKVVVAMKNYLEEHYNLKVMLDIHDISQTKHKDPFEWYNMAVYEADCVVIIVSPNTKPQPKEPPAVVDYSTLKAQTLKKRGENNEIIYQYTFSLGISLLISRIHGMMKDKNYNLDQFIVLIPPYSSENNIPSAGLNFRRFRIPDQMNAFLKHVQHCTNCPNLERSHVDCCMSNLRRNYSNGIELSSFGNSLESAIKSATNTIVIEPLASFETPTPPNEETALVENKVVADVENVLECSSSDDDGVQVRYSASEFLDYPPGARELPTLFSTE